MPGVLIDLGEMSRQSTINVAPDQDPASAIPGMPPAFGQWMMPHVLSFSGTVGSLSKVYRPSDEALQDSWDNARLIRNDLSVMECVEGRQRCVALLNWHLEPDNPKDPVQFEVAQHLTEICRKIPRFMQYRENLLHATFFGKYGVLNRWRWRRIAGRWRIAPDRWRPVHGDKIIFRYDPDSREWQDDQVGIRVGAMHVAHSLLHNRWPVEKVRQVAPTSEGLAYFLRAHERSLIAVHKHYVEDGEYEVPQNAGRIHGVGIRSRIYWTWYQKQETLAWLMEYLERSAGGFEIWYYPQGNPTAKEEVYKAARDRLSLGRNVILVPRTLGEPGAQPYDRIEPSMAGAEALKAIVVEYFGHQIKRYILGQTLTTEASNTGLGSNTADVHLATFYTIVEYDAQLLEETLTDDLIGPLMRYNFPWAQFGVRFKIDTKSDDAQEKMAAFLNAYQMGLKIKAQDVMDLVGASKPEPGDEVLWIGNRGPASPGLPPGTTGAPPHGPENHAGGDPPQGRPDKPLGEGSDDAAPEQHGTAPVASTTRPVAPAIPQQPQQAEQYARKAAPGQMSLFGNEGPKDPEFEQQHPREPDGTFREKNASESSASAAVPHADELKRKATGVHKEEDLEEADLKRRYEEYAVAMHQARITPRPWEQWKEAVAGARAQGGKAPDPKPAGDPEDTALRKRYEQYVHDVSSHGITPRPWEQWRQHLQRNVVPPTASDASTAAEPSVPVSPPTAKPPHETPLSHYKDGGMLPAELYDGLHRANDEESGFVVRVDKKPNGKYDVYLEGSHHKHLKSPYATDVDQDVARTAAWRAAGFSPENATILPSRVIENHRKLVREALERGDKVPEEVLRDYPELRPRVTTADPENPTVPPSEEEMNPLDVDEDLGEPGSGKAFEDELETESNEADVDEDADDPREAARRHAKALQDGYAYARASAVGNAGEDLLGSARHKINQWKGLESAESEGRGEELVTREHLLKGEPVDMLRHVTATNCLSSLAMHAAMRSFPPKPYDPAHRYYGRQTDEVKKRYRANYVDAYRTIKATAEQLARDEVDPKKALDQLRSVVAAEIVRIRQERLPYDPVANNLVNLQNRLSTYGRPKPNAPLGQVFEFVGRLKAAYGQDQITRDTLDKAAEHVRDVMEGDSLNKTFGTVGQGGKPKGFSAAEMYVTHATRKGGRVIDAETVKAGQDFVIDTLGMRGLQFGNYVTDEERQHHLRMSAEALADLMDVTGLPDRQASLDGVIGLAIGARGTSRALATYEPGNKVINLTRKGGVGSLAHEWGHAFDHHVAGGKLTSDLSGRSSGDYQSERLSAIRHERTDQGWQRVDRSEDPMHKAYDGLRQAWKQSGFLEQVKATGQRVFGEAWKTKRNYWMSNRELFARSFEVYVARQLSKQDRENTYLSGLNPVGDAAPLWPSQEQVDEMAPHFAAIFAAYRDRLQQPERSDPTPADASRQQEKYSLIHALNAATYQPRVVT